MFLSIRKNEHTKWNFNLFIKNWNFKLGKWTLYYVRRLAVRYKTLSPFFLSFHFLLCRVFLLCSSGHLPAPASLVLWQQTWATTSGLRIPFMLMKALFFLDNHQGLSPILSLFNEIKKKESHPRGRRKKTTQKGFLFLIPQPLQRLFKLPTQKRRSYLL